MSDAKGTPKKGVQSQDAKKQPEENGDAELNKVSDDIELSLNADEEDLEEVEAENEAGGEYDSPLKAAMKALAMSTCVKILGFKRSNNMETDLATWHKFFKEQVEVDVPQIQPPGLDDLWIIFKMKTIQDKHKLFQWVKKNKYDGVKLRVKTITIKESKDVLEVEELPLDDALDILYPRRNVLYADQLKDKHASMKTIIDENLLPMKEIEKFTKSKKYLKNIKTREMLPFSPMDGYEHNVLIYLEKKENGEVSYGLRVVRHAAGNEATKLATTIVPLEQCLSVPRQMTLGAKNILAGLTKAGLEPYCPANKEGELLGFSLRINHHGHFMLIVIVKKPGAIAFHEFTPEKVVLNDGEPLGEPYRALVQNKVKEINEKVTQFYESEGKGLGIRSVYSTLLPEQVILYQMSSGVWNNLPRPEHVVGDQQLIDKINGVTLKITWDREKYTEIYNSVLPLFDGVTFNNTTKVYLVSPNKHIGYYFAKKCGHVTQIGLRQPDFGSKFKPDNVKNLEFLNFTAKLRKPVSTENTVVVWWPFTLTASTRKNKKFNLVQQFLNFGLTNMAFITFWGKNNDNLDKYQNHMESVYSKLKINRIIPFDTEPYKDGYGLFVLFKGYLDEVANKPGIPNKFSSKFSPKFSRGGGAVGARGRGGFKRPLGSAPGPRDIRVMRRVDPFERQSSGAGGFGGRGGSSGGGFGGRGGFSGPKRPSALQRLGPRLNDYQGPAESPWSQDSSSTQNAWNQIEQVAGVVQNLQNMAQQMQAFIEHKQQPAQQQSSSWSLKRRYPEDDDYQGERSGGSSGGRWAGMGSGGGRSGSDSWGDSGRQASGDYNRWQGATGNGTAISQARPADSYYDMIDYNHDNKRRREDISYTDSRSGGEYGGSGWGAGGGSSQASNSYTSSYGDRPSTWGKPTVSAAPTYYNHSSAPNHPSTRNYY